MTRLFLVISLSWLFPTVCHTLDIPIQSALLIKGEPVGFTTAPHRQKRSETLNGSVTCKEDEYRPRKAKHCCNKCLAGFMVATDCSEEGMKSKCTPCHKGFFRKTPNGSKSCSLCADCLTQFGQITLYPCTTINDTVCGCPTGLYKSSHERKFTCVPCNACENGTPAIPCTADRDTVCKCFFNFYLDSDGKCSSCKECNNTEECRNHCPQMIEKPEVSESDVLPFILPGVMGLIILALVTVVIVKYRQKLISIFKESSLLPTTDVSASVQLSTPLMESSNQGCKLDSLPGHVVHVVQDSIIQQQNTAQNSTLPLPDITLQTTTSSLNSPDVLYKIIECIPVGRWREFVRRLGVSNHVIDTSEQENRHYKDAQYAMLSDWVLNAGSSGDARDSMFKLLREMNLGGCAERIEEIL